MVGLSSGAGSVTAYNYMDMGFDGGTDGWQEAGLNNSHIAGSHLMLFDGNYDYKTHKTHWVANAPKLPNSLFLTSAPSFFAGYKLPRGRFHRRDQALRVPRQGALRR